MMWALEIESKMYEKKISENYSNYGKRILKEDEAEEAERSLYRDLSFRTQNSKPDGLKNRTTELRVWMLNHKVCRLFEEVLNRKPSTVGTIDNFLELGGNSLLAMKLMNKINEKFNVSMSASTIFECNSIRSFVARLEQQLSHPIIIPKLVPGKREQVRLSFRMELLWDDFNRYPNVTSYNISNIFRIQKGFQQEKVQKALYRIVQRHEILRTVVHVSADGKPYMFITHKKPEIGKVSVKHRNDLQQAILNFNDKQFQLTEDIPIRVSIFEVDNSDSYIVICFNHIATDIWSHEIFLNELCEFYKNDQLQKPPLEIQYKDYAAFQRTLYTGKLLEEHLSFWKAYLCGFERLNLKSDFTPKKCHYNDLGISAHFVLDSEQSAALRGLAKYYDASLFSLMLSAFYIMLVNETGQMDITVSTSVACREMFQLNELIGLVSNEVPIRQSISPETALEKLVESVWKNVNEVQKYSGLPLSRILTEAGFHTDGIADENTWIPVSFQVDEMETQDCQYEIPIQRCDAENPLLFDKAYNYDLSVFINVKGPFEGVFVFAKDLYRQETAQRFTGTFVRILQKMAEVKECGPKVDTFLNNRSVNEI